MLYKEIFRVLSKYFLYLTVLLFVPLLVAFYFEVIQEPASFSQHSVTLAFIKTQAICLLAAMMLRYLGSGSQKGPLFRKESLFLVALIWFLTAAVGALPFLFSHRIESPLDAYFESMSGLTTTGATVLHPKAYCPASGAEIPVTVQNPLNKDVLYTFYGTIGTQVDPILGNSIKGIEALGRPLLFWRSFLQWVGGLGIVVLFVAILPALSLGGKFLYEGEMAGPSKEGMTPRIKETALILWKIYLALTALQIGVLAALGLPLFDATSLAFTTISTGGFTVHNEGLSFYPKSVHFVLIVFMALGALNFSLFFHFLKRKIYRLYDVEFLYYALLICGGSGLMAALLLQSGLLSPGEAFYRGSFQAISALTTSGFSLTSYDHWPVACQVLMLLLMYVSGMSGSTAGGIKIARFLIVIKMIKFKLESFFRPDSVRILKVGQKEIGEKTANLALTFFCIVVFLAALGMFLLVLDGIDPVTSLGVISTTITNTGLFFGGAGSSASLAFLPPFSKVVAILWMVLGRLEFFSLLVLLLPSYWRSR